MLFGDEPKTGVGPLGGDTCQDEPRAFTMSVHCKENFPFGFKVPLAVVRHVNSPYVTLDSRDGGDTHLARQMVRKKDGPKFRVDSVDLSCGTL